MTEERYLRVLTLEVASLHDEKEKHWALFDEIREAMIQAQEVQNFFFDSWRAWHFQNDSAAKIKRFHDDWRIYIESGKKTDKPKLEVAAVDNGWAKAVYHQISEKWPTLHTRTTTLLIKCLTELVKSSKSTKGNWAKWHSWLLHREQIPSFVNPVPLPFDKANTFLEAPKDSNGSHVLHLNLKRYSVPGLKNCRSTTFHCAIRDRSRSMASRRIVLSKIARGDLEWAGSKAFIKDNKLFIALAYWLPKPDRAVGSKTAILHFRSKSPAALRIAGRSIRIGGDGQIIPKIRRQVLAQRWSRKTSYRYCASSARKGHGTRRAIEKITILSKRWRDFVKTTNRNMAAQVIKVAIQNDAGAITVLAPRKESRFLSVAGQSTKDKSSWDWSGLEKAISDQAMEYGVAVNFEKPRCRQTM